MRTLTVIAIVYVVLLGVALGWHIAYGEPFSQTTFPLVIVFAVSTALVGLVSLWGAIGMLHWAKRAVGFTLAATALVGLWLVFFNWNRFLIWQLIMILSVQMAVLVVVLGLLRFNHVVVLTDVTGGKSSDRRMQMSIMDLLLLTASLAALCAVIRTARPVQLSMTIYILLLAAGCCAAFTTLISLWIALSHSPLFAKVLVFALIAPIGGAIHAIGSQYTSLLFNWVFYSGVTTLQMIFMIVPLKVVRERGIQFESDVVAYDSTLASS